MHSSLTNTFDSLFMGNAHDSRSANVVDIRESLTAEQKRLPEKAVSAITASIKRATVPPPISFSRGSVAIIQRSKPYKGVLPV